MTGVNLTHASSLGPIVYVSTFGKPLIVLNSFSVARELLQKRGNIYSGRPRLVAFSEMWDFPTFSSPSALLTYLDTQDGMGIRTKPVIWRA
jgi:hypothetical protein